MLDAGRNGNEPEADQQGRGKGQPREGKAGSPEGGGAVLGHGVGALGWTRWRRSGGGMFKAICKRNGSAVR